MLWCDASQDHGLCRCTCLVYKVRLMLCKEGMECRIVNIFLHFLSFSFIFFHFLSLSFHCPFIVLSFSLHFLSFSFIFFHFLSCSFMFFHFLSFSFIFFHFLSFSLSLFCAQNLIFLGLNFVTISRDSSQVKNQFLGPSRVVPLWALFSFFSCCFSSVCLSFFLLFIFHFVSFFVHFFIFLIF